MEGIVSEQQTSAVVHTGVCGSSLVLAYTLTPELTDPSYTPCFFILHPLSLFLRFFFSKEF